MQKNTICEAELMNPAFGTNTIVNYIKMTDQKSLFHILLPEFFLFCISFYICHFFASDGILVIHIFTPHIHSTSHFRMHDYDDSGDDTDSDFGTGIWVPRREMAARKVRIKEPLRQSYVDLAS